MKRIVLFMISLVLVVVALVQTSGCANVIPPQGGPRDSLPPVLLSVNPPDSSTNFRGRRVEFTFDEFIDLRDVPQNVLVTPTFENNPPIRLRLRTITIDFEQDQPEPNTTYTIQFGNALRDYNEGNILRDFTYTFSTGPYLDSLQLAGRVIIAETGRTDSTLAVILHNSLDDSAVVNNRPRYVARVDSSGYFRFRNLPAGRFAIYAVSGVGGRRYSAAQPFAFADAPIALPMRDSITLYAYQSTRPTGAAGQVAPARPNPADRNLKYTTNQTGRRQELNRNLEIRFERPLRYFDSGQIALTLDSTFTPLTNFTTTLDTSRKLLTITSAWIPDTLYNLVLQPDVAEDTLGRKLQKIDTVSFNTKAVAEYGSINLRIRNIKGENAVVQFVQNDVVQFAAPITTGVYRAALFIPGEYELRILYDRNNNGIWDPGNFFGVKRQPEIVRPVTRRITVKPALDNDFDITL